MQNHYLILLFCLIFLLALLFQPFWMKIVFPIFNFPQWTSQFIIIVLLLGFPIAVILSWIFDKTPQGYIKTDAKETEKIGGMSIEVDTRPFYKQKRNI